MTMLDLDELERLAKAATPGPWVHIPNAEHRHELREVDRLPPDRHWWPYRIAQTVEGQTAERADRDFAYLRACDPQTILRLVEAARRLLGDGLLSAEYLDQMQAHVDEGGQLSHRNGVELLRALRETRQT